MANASYRTVQQVNFKFDNNSGVSDKYAKIGIAIEILTKRNTGAVTYSTGQVNVSSLTAKLDAYPSFIVTCSLFSHEGIIPQFMG